MARRSEIQRMRHAEDPFSHETALRNLEGRLNEWKEEQILKDHFSHLSPPTG